MEDLGTPYAFYSTGGPSAGLFLDDHQQNMYRRIRAIDITRRPSAGN